MELSVGKIGIILLMIVLISVIFYLLSMWRTKNQIICPNVNCGYQGSPKRISRGNLLIGLLLLLFGVVPGLLYFAIMRGYRYYCPKCGLQIATDT